MMIKLFDVVSAIVVLALGVALGIAIYDWTNILLRAWL